MNHKNACLSFDDGTPIAALRIGSKMAHPVILHYDEQGESPIDTQDDYLIEKAISDALRELKIKRQIKSEKIFKYKEWLQEGIDPTDVKDHIYKEVFRIVDERMSKELEVYDGDLIPFPPLPSTYEPKVKVGCLKMYVVGPGMAGKSFFIGKFTKQFVKLWREISPDPMKVYLFSPVDVDESLDTIKGIERINLEENFSKDCPDIPLDEFKDSICIFDDIGGIQDKSVREKVYKLKDSMLMNGRHHGKNGIHVIHSSHLTTDFSRTKVDLAEANAYCFFIHAIQPHAKKYFLENHLGFSRQQMERIESVPGRWVYIRNKLYPNVVLHEKGAFIV